MRPEQHVKAALAQNGQAGWVVQPNPDQQAAQVARAAAAPSQTSSVAQPNPDEQTVTSASTNTGPCSEVCSSGGYRYVNQPSQTPNDSGAALPHDSRPRSVALSSKYNPTNIRPTVVRVTNPSSVVTGVNDGGEIVGTVCCESAALLCAGGRQYDLTPVVAPSALRLIVTDYIDDHGDVVGHGALPNGDQPTFLLIRNPSVPPPAGITGFARDRYRHRLHHQRPTPSLARWLMREFGARRAAEGARVRYLGSTLVRVMSRASPSFAASSVDDVLRVMNRPAIP